MSLPQTFIAMLRGEVVYSEECSILKLAREFYQAGKAGRPYVLNSPPKGLFPVDIVKIMDNFLRKCWEQGRSDRAGIAGDYTN